MLEMFKDCQILSVFTVSGSNKCNFDYAVTLKCVMVHLKPYQSELPFRKLINVINYNPDQLHIPVKLVSGIF